MAGPEQDFNSIYLRVITIGAWTLQGLLNRLLSIPPIPFESGVDFSLNCSVYLVKLTVFKLCHLVSPGTPNSVAQGCQLLTLLV